MKTNNKDEYWFKRRRYGYGWVPVTWQGWLTIGALLAIVIGSGFLFEDASQDGLSGEAASYLAIIFAAILSLLVITFKKGPNPPKWRMGKSPSDNPDEDF